MLTSQDLKKDQHGQRGKGLHATGQMELMSRTSDNSQPRTVKLFFHSLDSIRLQSYHGLKERVAAFPKDCHETILQ